MNNTIDSNVMVPKSQIDQKTVLTSKLSTNLKNDVIIKSSSKRRDEYDSQKRSVFIQREIIKRTGTTGSITSNDIVQSDNDIWIERSYKTSKGRTVRYYSSMLTNKMFLLQPPTGAAYVLYEHDMIRERNVLIKEYIQTLPPVTKELVETMNKPQKGIEFLESLGFECRPVQRRNIFHFYRRTFKSTSKSTVGNETEISL